MDQKVSNFFKYFYMSIILQFKGERGGEEISIGRDFCIWSINNGRPARPGEDNKAFNRLPIAKYVPKM